MSSNKNNTVNSKGSSGNTNGGTETSFTNTPQAKDDYLGTLQSGQLNYINTVYVLDVMQNDLGGNAKSLWSVDDGINNSGAMSGYIAGDLLTQDAPGVTGVAANRSLYGAALHITSDGRVAYDTSTIDATNAVALTGLALGDVLTDSFIYAIRLANGTLSWANASVTLTGVNDVPVAQGVSLAAVEDAGAVTGSFNGDDVDSDDDGNTLIYSIIGAPSLGTLINNGFTFTYDPGSNYQSLALGETSHINLSYTATDRHGAVSDPASLKITVTGVNDAPTLAAGALGATAGGAAVSLDLSALGNDIDSDDDGSTLTYSLLNTATIGSASITGTTLTYVQSSTSSGSASTTTTTSGDDSKSSSSDSKSSSSGTSTTTESKTISTLASGETTTFDLLVRATDTHGATDDNTVTVTVTGVNDAPVMASGALSATEDGDAVTLDLAALGDDIDSDDDGSTLTYSLLSSPAGGTASISGTTLTFNPGADFQSLAAGQTQNLNLQVQATDKHDASASNNVTVTVTGVNDAPVINGGDTAGAVTAASGQGRFTVEQWTGYAGPFSLANLESHAGANAANYTVTTSVIDFTDDPGGFSGEIPGSSPWPAAVATGASGTGGINNHFFARVTATILITQTDTYTFRTFNDDGVYLRVNNQLIINDPTQHAELPFEGSITLTPGVYPLELYYFENGGEASLELTFKNSTGIYQHVTSADVHDSGNLLFSDVDLTDSHTVSVAPAGNVLGSLTAVKTADTTGTGTGGNVKWDYSVGVLSYQSLGEGETAVESFIVSVDDGNGGIAQQQVDITITGTNDVAVLGNAVAYLTETDAPLTTGGTLSISDPDNGEAFFNAQNNTAGTYGTFSIDANGVWTYATNGALDYLAEGQKVNDIFNVTSVDGTATTVTVNITGTADGPTAVNDSNTLSASSPAQSTGNTVYWADWKTITPIAGSVHGEVKVDGTITLPSGTIGVTYTGQIYAQQTFISPSNTTNYWASHNGATWLPGGQGVYTSAEVANGPSSTNFDFIALALANTPRNLSFSEPVANLFFAVASMNNNGYLFDQPFTVVSSASASNDRGYWGYTAGYTLSENNGQYGISTAGFSPNEFHGVLAINNAVDSLTWFSQSVEYWQGFTVGTYGIAQSATAAGNVLANDDAGGVSSTIEVSEAGGQTMVGNSVTLTLASGAILRVDRDGGYLYNDNGKFEYLGAGQAHTESVQYTVKDNQGNTDTATLSITVNGVNDAPVAVNDAVSTNEDVAVTINVLANDTDVDNGDSKFLVSATNGQKGTVAVSGNSVVYTPNANVNGNDSFSYTMRDAAGLTSTATVNVTINPVTDTYVISNLVTNGSFENGTTGWTVNQINYIGDWQAADGTKTLDLNAESGGGYVEQTLQTVSGVQYTVAFALSKNPGSPSGTETLRVTAADSSQDYVFSQSNSTSNMMWAEHTFTFVAQGSTTNLRLASADPTGGTDAWGPALDEVVAVTNTVINGFQKGATGDVLDLSSLLTSINAPRNSNAFSSGFLDFQQSGSDTIVRIDADGGADNFIVVATLVGVNLTQLDGSNYLL